MRRPGEDSPPRIRHDIRHTTASFIVSETGSLAAAKEILGHATIKTTQRYAHLLEEAPRRAVEALERVLENDPE